MPAPVIKILETPEEMNAVEALQRAVWPGSETDIAPAHVFIAAIHNGGLVAGAYLEDQLVGFVFGFPGIEFTPDGPRPKHCSHMLGILPGYRDSGVGFALKRAQWQMVRHQGLDHITWTYDPLLSRNAYLNITKLGAVCDTYRRSEYGDMRDGLNAGLPSDRFQVDWWINTRRVERRLSKRPRRPLKLDDFSKAELEPLYVPHVARQPFGTAQGAAGSWPRPPEHFSPLAGRLILAEIPSNFSALKEADFALARDWRFFTREVFETAFAAGYIVTDFVYDAGRSFYVLSHGESTLEQ
jgi:predicted GNAT superfamily acetyltransferase